MSRIRLVASITIIIAVLLGCVSPFSTYIDNMYWGRNLLRQGQYQKARERFLVANNYQPAAVALAFAGVASYKMGDLDGAGQYLTTALAMGGQTDAYFVIAGYRALVFLAEGKRREGLIELNAYIVACRHVQPISPSMKDPEFNIIYGRYPPSASLKAVEVMASSGQIDVRSLEQLIDQQISETEIVYNKL
jgi:tetratricopeptide (TPR) repeat protein